MSSPTIFSFMCMFCTSLFVLLYFFFWPLCCLCFFDLWILITLLLSLNSSYTILTRATRWVPLVEKEPHTLHEYLSSPTVFSAILVVSPFVFCVFFDDHCLTVLFLLIIVLFVLIRIMASHYPFGIFNFFWIISLLNIILQTDVSMKFHVILWYNEI
jgi:hypothetical protein